MVDRLRRVVVTEDGCHLWTGELTSKGYGIVTVRGRRVKAHRYAYGQAHGSVPPLLDHVCHDPQACPGGPACVHRRCVNPAHLVPSDAASNVAPDRRSRRWRGTCQRGHDVTQDDAVYVRPDGTRECRQCRAMMRPAR